MFFKENNNDAEMFISDLDDFVRLPITIDKDSEYLDVVSKKLNEFSNWLELFMEKSVVLKKLSLKEKKDIVKQIKIDNNVIIDSIEKYLHGDVAKAAERINGLLFRAIKMDTVGIIKSDLDNSYSTRGVTFFPMLQDEKNKLFYEKQKESELTFFRARTQYYNDYKEMYHIPLDKRELVGTERFSIPGVPCLYIGASVYDIWLEMGRPPYCNFNVSSIRFKPEGKRLKILNLTITPYVLLGIGNIQRKELYTKDVLLSLIRIYPLVISTSIRNRFPSGKFRSEYIISHLIMLNLKNLGIDGVAYYSKRIEDSREDYAFPQFVNIAFPSFGTSKSCDKYADICDKIEITRPVNLEEFLGITFDGLDDVKNSFFAKSFPFASDPYFDSSEGIIVAGKPRSYHRTEFYNFENYICGLRYYSLGE